MALIAPLITIDVAVDTASGIPKVHYPRGNLPPKRCSSLCLHLLIFSFFTPRPIFFCHFRAITLCFCFRFELGASVGLRSTSERDARRCARGPKKRPTELDFGQLGLVLGLCGVFFFRSSFVFLFSDWCRHACGPCSNPSWYLYPLLPHHHFQHLHQLLHLHLLLFFSPRPHPPALSSHTPTVGTFSHFFSLGFVRRFHFGPPTHHPPPTTHHPPRLLITSGSRENFRSSFRSAEENRIFFFKLDPNGLDWVEGKFNA